MDKDTARMLIEAGRPCTVHPDLMLLIKAECAILGREVPDYIVPRHPFEDGPAYVMEPK